MVSSSLLLFTTVHRMRVSELDYVLYNNDPIYTLTEVGFYFLISEMGFSRLLIFQIYYTFFVSTSED